MRLTIRLVVTWISAVAVLGMAAPAVQAAVTPVNPGPAAAGKPISWSNMNLPPLDAVHPYDAGEGFAPQIEAYYGSGQVRADQAAVAASALRWTRGWLKSACGGLGPSIVRTCKAMAIFDIDETLLDNYTYYSTTSPVFSFIPATWGPYQASCKATANAAVTALYSRLRALGVRVAVVTGRNATSRDVTTACLKANGATGWTALVMQEPADAKLTAAQYKAQARAALEKQGWRIGPSIGDQVSDMSNGHLAHGFLLPNPMYYIP